MNFKLGMSEQTNEKEERKNKNKRKMEFKGSLKEAKQVSQVYLWPCIVFTESLHKL